jgi:hypothetical protein
MPVQTTTDDESLASPEVDGSGVGQIVVKLCRGNKALERFEPTSFRPPKETSHFHERRFVSGEGDLLLVQACADVDLPTRDLSLKKSKASHATV